MHYLTLDTNTWIYLANGTEPVRLLNFIKQEVEKRNITLLLPKIIKDEWQRNKEKKVKQGVLIHFKEIITAFERFQKLLGDKAEQNYLSFLLDEKDDKDYFNDTILAFKKKKEEIEAAIAENIKTIDDLFTHKNTVLIQIKDETYIKAGTLALERKAPFRDKNSFADALIVLSFIEYVKSASIEGAIFISYNTSDFCEINGKTKTLHRDLETEFLESKSKFYHIVGEALNTIENDIISQEELDFIEELNEEAERYTNIVLCQVCDEMNDKLNEVYFDSSKEVIDYRNLEYTNPKQLQLEFVNNSGIKPKTKIDLIEVGYCSWCNTEHFICVKCGSVNAIWNNEYDKVKVCEKCGLKYKIRSSSVEEDSSDGIYIILNDVKLCEKCGKEIDNDDNEGNLCEKCEDEYAFGD